MKGHQENRSRRKKEEEKKILMCDYGGINYLLDICRGTKEELIYRKAFS
jgi:hypothetical protein